jgi:hypothetical protein
LAAQKIKACTVGTGFGFFPLKAHQPGAEKLKTKKEIK